MQAAVGPRKRGSAAATRQRSAPVLEPETPWGHLIATTIAGQQREPFACTEVLPIRGVTFTNDETGVDRQTLVQQLRPNQPVWMVKQPDNAFDPHAVKIVSFEGQLGFVPRELTHLFTDPVVTGYVMSSGPGRVAYGATVQCIPAMRSAFIDVLPRSVAGHTDLSAGLPPPLWAALEQAQLAQSFEQCQVTGLNAAELEALRPENPGGDQQLYAPSQTVRAHPVWQVCESQRVVRLTGLVSLCTPVHLLRYYLELEDLIKLGGHPRGGQLSASQRMLAEFAAAFGEDLGLQVAQAAAHDALRCATALYRPAAARAETTKYWTMDHVRDYATWCWRERARMVGAYKLDLSWLFQQEVEGEPVRWEDLTPELQSVAMPPAKPARPVRRRHAVVVAAGPPPEVKVEEREVKVKPERKPPASSAGQDRRRTRVKVEEERPDEVKVKKEAVDDVQVASSHLSKVKEEPI